MITWKDQTIHDKYESDRTPRVWGATAGKLYFLVLRNRDYPNTWFVRCDAFWTWPRDLETDDIEEAKRIACDMVYTELRKALEALDA